MSPAVVLPALGAGFASGIAAGGLFSLPAFAVTAALSGVSYAINRNAGKNAGDLTAPLTQTIKSPTAARRIIYGERRVSGTLVHIGTSNDDKYKHLVIALAGHEVESISDIYLNDNPLSHYNKYGDKPRATVDWGTGLISSINLNELSVTVNGQTHTGVGATLISELGARGFIVSGDFGSYEVRDGVFEDQAHLEITVADVDDTLTVTSSNGTVKTNISSEVPVVVRTYLGTPDQLADADLITALPEWTAAHRLREIAYIVVRLRYEFEAFPSGIPNVTALVRGKKDIYDPRTLLTGYSANPALCVADYLASEKYGFGAQYGDEISNTDLIAAANNCDEQVALVAGGTENRYTCHGVIDSSVDPQLGIEAILSSMAGTAVYTGGLWTISAGVYAAPVITLDESDCRAGITLQTRLSRAENCNGVKGVYTSPENEYQPADFPAIKNATYLAEDNNERIWTDIDLPFTTSPGTAQRLAKIILEQARQGMTLKYPCKLSALPLTAGNTVNIDNTRFGWANKPFRVVDWEFVIDDESTLGIDLLLRETAAGVFDWNSGEETTVDLAPNTSLPSPWFVAPVTNLTLTESTYVNSDGAIIPSLTVGFDPSVSPVEFYRIELYAAPDDLLWDSRESVDPTCVFQGLKGGTVYRVRVTAFNHLGAYSTGVVQYVGLIGLPGPPAAPTALVATGIPGGIQWDWVNTAAEYALLGTEIYVSTTNDRATASLLNTVLGNSYNHPFDPGTTLYAWIRSLDKAATESEWYPLSATAGVVGTSGSVDYLARPNNQLPNTEFTGQIADPAGLGWNPNGHSVDFNIISVTWPAGEWRPVGADGVYLRHNSAPEGGATSDANGVVSEQIRFFNSSAEAMPVEAGKRYEFSSRVANHRCPFAMFMVFYDQNGVQLGSANTYVDTLLGGGALLENWHHATVFGTAPANAATCYPVVRMYDTNVGETSSYVFVCRPYLGEAATEQIEPTPYIPSGLVEYGADSTTAALEAFTEISAGGLRMTDIATGDYVEMTPGELEFYQGSELYKSVRRVVAGIQSSGSPVVFSPPFNTTPKILPSLKEVQTFESSEGGSDHRIVVEAQSITPSGFTPITKLVLQTGIDTTSNFTLDFSSAAQSRQTINTTIDSVTLTLDTVRRNIPTYEEVHDGVFDWVDHWYSVRVSIEYQIGSGAWVPNYTGYIYTGRDAQNNTPFVRSINGLNSGADRVTIRVTNLGLYQLVENGSSAGGGSSTASTTATFTKLRELAQADLEVAGEVTYLAIEGGA